MKKKLRPKPSTVKLASEKVGLLMLSIVVITLISYLYLDFIHVYGPTIIHWCIVCAICFFTYKNKRWARICYYIFSAILIFMGGCGVLVFFEKRQGKLCWIQDRAVWLAIGRAILQIVSIYLLHRWAEKEDSRK